MLAVAAATPPALGYVIGANEKIRVGFIGTGGRGLSHIDEFKKYQQEWNVEPAAVCDIYEVHKQRAMEKAGLTEADVFHDYGDLLARQDIDAVVIATPDHWHMPMAIDALQAGKHVYVEKPMTRTFKEAQKLYQVWKQSRRILQVGAQYTALDPCHQARQVIASGDAGHILWGITSVCRNTPEGEWNYYGIDGNAGPHNIDWKRFLGSAPKRPWNPDRYFRWRKYWDYSGGIATDLFYHKMAPILVAIGPQFPICISAQGGIFVQKDDREVPDTFFITATMQNEMCLNLCATMANNTDLEDQFFGTEATLTLNWHPKRGGLTLTAQTPYLDKFKEKFGAEEYKFPFEERSSQQENFIKACRGLERPNCDGEIGYAAMAVIGLGVDAYRQGKTIFFDPIKQKVISHQPKSWG